MSRIFTFKCLEYLSYQGNHKRLRTQNLNINSMNNSESKIPEIIFNNVANLTGYWRIFWLNILIMKSDMRLTTLGISLNPVNSSLNSKQEGPQQYIKAFNSSIGILKTTAGISILITKCFTIGSNSTYIELEHSTLNISNSVFYDVVNDLRNYTALVFAWGNSKVTIQDTIIKFLLMLGVVINHSELQMKNVSFKRCTYNGAINDKTIIVSSNSSVVSMDTCSFGDFTCFSNEHRRRNWTFATLNGNLFSNKCQRKRLNYIYSKTLVGCTLRGAANVALYFEDTVAAMYSTRFDCFYGLWVLVWVSKHSKLYTHDFRFFKTTEIAILAIDSQVKTVKCHSGYGEHIPDTLIVAQDSNVSINDYNLFGGGTISFVNSYATIENSIFAKITNLYGGAIFANGSTLRIENSTFKRNVGDMGPFTLNMRYVDMYLTNSTLSGIYLQLTGIMIMNQSFINIMNSEVTSHNSDSFSVYVADNSAAHFTSTMFLSGKQQHFDNLLKYDDYFLCDDGLSVFFTCSSSQIVFDDCNFVNTPEFRTYLFSNITFLNTNFENNAGIYEVADDSYLKFDRCSLLRGAEKVFVNKGSVVSITNSNIAYSRATFTLLNKSHLRLLNTNIYDNIFGNFILAQFQSTILISNCIYSNNSRIEGNYTTEVRSQIFSRMIKTATAAVNDTAAFINISSCTIKIQDSTLSENVGSLIVTSMSNVTFNNCIIENNVALSRLIRFMEFTSTNVNIERCSFFNNNNRLFTRQKFRYVYSGGNEYRILKSEALILMRSGLKEPGNFVRLEYSLFNNSGVVILENILDTCIQSCNFSNALFQMESTSTADVLKKMFVLRVSASNFCCPLLCKDCFPGPFPFLNFVKGTSRGLNLFSSASVKDVLLKMFTYQQKGFDYGYSNNVFVAMYDKVLLRHEENAYASGKFPLKAKIDIILHSQIIRGQ